MNDLITIIDSLDVEAIQQKLKELAAHQAALRVLLRAAIARDRSSPNHDIVKEVPHGH